MQLLHPIWAVQHATQPLDWAAARRMGAHADVVICGGVKRPRPTLASNGGGPRAAER